MLKAGFMRMARRPASSFLYDKFVPLLHHREHRGTQRVASSFFFNESSRLQSFNVGIRKMQVAAVEEHG
jgi:hypothetical protein